MQVAILSPEDGGAFRWMAVKMSWFAHLGGIMEMADVIVTQGLRPVVAGSEEWVGIGKGGRASPGLGHVISDASYGGGKNWENTNQDAIMKSRNLRCGIPKSAQLTSLH